MPIDDQPAARAPARRRWSVLLTSLLASLRLALLTLLLSAGPTHRAAAQAAPASPGTPKPNPAKPDPASQLTVKTMGLLQQKCSSCHNANKAKAGVNVQQLEALLRGGDSGRVIQPGRASESRLLQLVRDGEMPPEPRKPLHASEVRLLEEWINRGAGAVGTRDVPDQHDVLPLLALRCAVCHGRLRREAKLDLRSRDALLRGGKSGPAIVLGQPDKSLLVQKVHNGSMPPRDQLAAVSVKPMQDHELDIVRRWIEAGAPQRTRQLAGGIDPQALESARDYWAFRPPKRPALPRPTASDGNHAGHRAEDQVNNVVDVFILHKLRENTRAGTNSLSLSAAADRRVLIRRLCFDLWGLPPTADMVHRFANDTRPGATQRLVDRLLASPRYGERWGVFWLDLAGYSDSEGVQHSDPQRPFAYRYRDYVIRCLNRDQPYDQFLHQQLAGDELIDFRRLKSINQQQHDNLVATGFLRQGADGTFAGITSFVPDRLAVIDDCLEIVSSALMGLTLRCARCHDHKFDPLAQSDYYRLRAVFKGALDENDWLLPRRQNGEPGTRDRYLPYVVDSERRQWQQRCDAIRKQIAGLKADKQRETDSYRQRSLQTQLARLPKPLHDDLRKMLATPANKRDEILTYLASKFERQLRVDDDQLKQQFPEYVKRIKQLDDQVVSLEKQMPPQPLIRALWDRGQASQTYVLRRGDYLQPGRPVAAGPPSVLDGVASRYAERPPWPGAESTGRRLAFARWLTHPRHPLTARVLVNRVWKHHFGRGIVSTLDNFGKAGQPPTHPELLDYLAVEFVAHDWSLKWLHRLLLNSRTYAQQSVVNPQRRQLDPDNRWLSRMPLQRLDAESLRDSLLVVSDQLDLRSFGPPDEVDARADGLVVAAKRSPPRRSVFVLKRRTQALTILEVFDRPDMSPNCVARAESTVANQALHLLNNGRVYELAQSFASRVRRESAHANSNTNSSTMETQIRTAFRLALQRSPTADELHRAVNYLRKLQIAWQKQENGDAATASRNALTSFCHALLNSAEFIYVD